MQEPGSMAPVAQRLTSGKRTKSRLHTPCTLVQLFPKGLCDKNGCDLQSYRLGAASQIREKEASNFDAVEKDLVETSDIFERAIGVIEKEQNKAASMLQLRVPRAWHGLWLPWFRLKV